MRYNFFLVLLIPILTISCAKKVQDPLAKISPTTLDSLLSMTEHDFDQTPKGWRQYQDDPALQAALIKAYMQKNAVRSTVMVWHVGQLFAAADQYDSARVYMRQSYKTLDGNDDILGKAWNYYVDGTLAFLDNDTTRLKLYVDSLANNGIRMNLQVLEGLLANIGKRYKDAY